MTRSNSTKGKLLITVLVLIGLCAAAYFALPLFRHNKRVELPTGHYVITVNGKALASLSSKHDADEALNLLKHAYDKPGARAVGQSTFKENVNVVYRMTDTGVLYSSPKEALDALTEPIEPEVVHTVVRGDRAVNIAEKYRVSLEEIQGLNPKINVASLNEGDTIKIRPAKRAITVVSSALVVQTIEINPPADMAKLGSRRTGKRTMKVLQTCENGEPIKQDVISNITTWERPRRLHYRTKKTTKSDATGEQTTKKTDKPAATPVSDTTPPAPSTP